MLFKKKILFIIFIGFFISIITSFINLNKYDQISNQLHPMIIGDIKLIWVEAEK